MSCWAPYILVIDCSENNFGSEEFSNTCAVIIFLLGRFVFYRSFTSESESGLFCDNGNQLADQYLLHINLCTILVSRPLGWIVVAQKAAYLCQRKSEDVVV